MCVWTLESSAAGLKPAWFFLMQAHFTRTCRRGSSLHLSGPETLGWQWTLQKGRHSPWGGCRASVWAALLCARPPLIELQRGFLETHPCPSPLAGPSPPPAANTSLFILGSYSLLFPLGGRLAPHFPSLTYQKPGQSILPPCFSGHLDDSTVPTTFCHSLALPFPKHKSGQWLVALPFSHQVAAVLKPRHAQHQWRDN